MWYTPTVTVEPGNEPVTLQEAKRQVRAEDFADDDAYLQDLIAVARSHVEGYCGARFASQTVEIECDDFADFAHVSVSPITSVSGIEYVDTGGEPATVGEDVYELRGNAIVLTHGKSWPARQPKSLITATLEVGFFECPPAVKHAMRLWIADAYANRENAAAPEWTALDALLCNHRYY